MNHKHIKAVSITINSKLKVKNKWEYQPIKYLTL